MVWAYFILDAATIATCLKLIDLPRPDAGYQVQEESSDNHPVYQAINFTMPIDQAVLPSKLGLFVSQPAPNIPLEQPAPESRYGLVFTRSPLTKKRRGVPVYPEGLSLFTKVDKNRPKDIFEKYRQNEYQNPVPLGSDRYLTPQFVKFKNEIEKETEKTHLRGMKLSKDAMHAPTVVYESPVYRKQKRKKNYFDSSPITSGDESYRKPYYEDPETYDKPTSYQRYSSTPSEPYLPPNYESSDATFPTYPPYPGGESEPYHIPRSESEARNPPYSFPRSYEFPSSYQTSDDTTSFPFPKSSRFPLKDEEESENDYAPEDYPPLPPKRLHKFVSPDDYNQAEDDEVIHRKPKRRKNKFGRPYGEPSEVPISVSRNNHDEDDEEFDANFELPSPDPFATDEEKESEEEEEVAPIPKGRLRLPSRQQPKRVPPAHRKRCVKKRKEMSMDDLDDEPGRQMACLVCENLDTGGTYETCSYESDPKKNSYYQGNAASYRKGTASKAPYKYRYKRDTVSSSENATKINASVPITIKANTTDATVAETRVTRRTKGQPDEAEDKEDEDNTGSYSADPADFGPENFTYDDDEYHEDLQDDDDNDDLEEYKPQPPAYANEHSCKEIVRGGATCMVCENPETNGKYEQCSYANEPDDAYEYAQSSSYGRGSNKSPKDRFRRSKLSNYTSDSGSANTTNSNITNSTPFNSTSHNISTIPNSLTPTDVKVGMNATDSKGPEDLLKDLRDIEQRKIEKVNEIFKTLVRTKKEQPNSRFLADIEDGSYEKQFLNMFPELSNGGTEADESMLKELATKPIFGKDDTIPGFQTKSKLSSNFKGFPKKSRFLDDDDEDTGNSELSKMMREFKTKDRSKCAKKMKNKMTCYVCNDKDGMKREECMYVVEDEPKKATVHELKDLNDADRGSSKTSKREIPAASHKKYKFVPPGEMQPASQTVVHQTIEARKYGSPVTVPSTYSNVQIRTEKTYSLRGVPSNYNLAPERHRRQSRRMPHHLMEPMANGSSLRRRFKRGRAHRRAAEEEEDTQQAEDPEETGEHKAIEVVPEADPSSPDGAFSDDTEVVYDKELKTSLPKFMVEKSEHENVVDEFLSKI